MNMRIGHGFDVHKFGGEGPIILCGITIENPKGLLAHSDGDVAIHALCDAIIGAMGKGDIGHWFPDNDKQFENIDSKSLLKEVIQVLAKNFQLINADITIIAQSPKISPYVAEMKKCLALLCHCQASQINVKATTTEKLGYIGREEGIAVHAVVLIDDKN